MNLTLPFDSAALGVGFRTEVSRSLSRGQAGHHELAKTSEQPDARLAWRREMERAQLSDWFKPLHPPRHAVGGSEMAAAQSMPSEQLKLDRPSPAFEMKERLYEQHDASPFEALIQQRSVGPQERANIWMSHAPYQQLANRNQSTGPLSASADEVSVVRHRVESPHMSPTAVAAIPKAFNTGVKVASTTELDARVNSKSAETAPAAYRLPDMGVLAPATRLHAHWTSEGARLWLGISGDASQVEGQTLLLVPALRSALQQQGYWLTRVVCNGKVVFDASSGSSTRPALGFNGLLLQLQACGHPSIASNLPTLEDFS